MCKFKVYKFPLAASVNLSDNKHHHISSQSAIAPQKSSKASWQIKFQAYNPPLGSFLLQLMVLTEENKLCYASRFEC